MLAKRSASRVFFTRAGAWGHRRQTCQGRQLFRHSCAGSMDGDALSSRVVTQESWSEPVTGECAPDPREIVRGGENVRFSKTSL